MSVQICQVCPERQRHRQSASSLVSAEVGQCGSVFPKYINVLCANEHSKVCNIRILRRDEFRQFNGKYNSPKVTEGGAIYIGTVQSMRIVVPLCVLVETDRYYDTHLKADIARRRLPAVHHLKGDLNRPLTKDDLHVADAEVRTHRGLGVCNFGLSSNRLPSRLSQGGKHRDEAEDAYDGGKYCEHCHRPRRDGHALLRSKVVSATAGLVTTRGRKWREDIDPANAYHQESSDHQAGKQPKAPLLTLIHDASPQARRLAPGHWQGMVIANAA